MAPPARRYGGKKSSTAGAGPSQSQRRQTQGTQGTQRGRRVAEEEEEEEAEEEEEEEGAGEDGEPDGAVSDVSLRFEGNVESRRLMCVDGGVGSG